MAKTFKITSKSSKIARLKIDPTKKIDPSKISFSKFREYDGLSKLDLQYILDNEELSEETTNYIINLIKNK
ncbi:MAG: hypothetical protein LBV22_03980 [Mycoplasmataceae bacterium]|jgi:hypothetical protein|nr:hypothetical protein [Mycoplasmataceae bacterium]